MDARTEPSPTEVPMTEVPTTPAPALGGMVDVEAILREVEALTQAAIQPAVASISASEASTPIAAPTPVSAIGIQQTNKDTLDVRALERELEALLRASGQSPMVGAMLEATQNLKTPRTPESRETPTTTAGMEATEDPGPISSAPIATDVSSRAIQQESMDPMLREIAEILDDTNEAIVRANDGSVDRALDTVFDPRALTGQEEDVNRALIEAFGTSRRATPAFGNTPAVVTNPVPRFEGISRAVPPEMASDSTASPASPAGVPPAATRTFEEIAAKSLARATNTEYAGETPFEPAFPVVPPLATTETTPVTRTDGTAASTLAPVATTPVASVVSVASTATTPAPTAQPSVAMTSPVVEPVPEFTAPVVKRGFSIAPLLRRAGDLISSIALLPLRMCALPMRAVPVSARGYVGIAAISMTLWVPVSWWMAQRSASTPGIGRIEFPVATSDHHAATEAAAADGHDAETQDHGASASQDVPRDASTATSTDASTGSSSAAAHH